jgi:diaminohydroxyphosphoribosylaminopyrimidine deaminase/5-amino-6-(5-phosphoribosylamino)uracil reductase
MAAAIRLSLWHRGLTGENPSVGALIVRHEGDGSLIVGRGVTAFGGRPHAELVALREAGPAARGATAYVTLEPCSHIGKAPPCADALVASGVSRVVIATLDPDMRVAGRGVSILRRAGIEVTTGCLEDEARRAMAGFLSLKGRGRPYITLKLAVSADGMIGRSGAGQVPITGETARRAVQVMRIEHEAIMVGAGTVAADDPLLNVRLPGLEERSPTPVIVDPFARTPPTARLLERASSHRVLIMASAKADRRRVEALKSKGADLRTIASDYLGRFDPAEVLRVLGVIGLKSVLLEGGAETARRFLDAGLVDRIALFTGETRVGPDGIASPITSSEIPVGFEAVHTASFGKDRLIEYERTA